MDSRLDFPSGVRNPAPLGLAMFRAHSEPGRNETFDIFCSSQKRGLRLPEAAPAEPQLPVGNVDGSNRAGMAVACATGWPWLSQQNTTPQPSALTLVVAPVNYGQLETHNHKSSWQIALVSR